MAILGQILARLGHFWALPKIFRNVSDHHRFQHKKYCGFGKFELLRRQSRHFFKIHYTMSIVNNFEIIEKYWQGVERTNHLLLGSILGLGITIVFLKFCRHG